MALEEYTTSNNDPAYSGRVDIFFADIDLEDKAFNAIVFKDQTTGTLYKLTIDNGVISLVEYTP